MRTIAIIAGGILLSGSAQAASVDLGGRFYPGFASGYVDAVINNYVAHDGTGDVNGDLISFSTPPLAPVPEIVTLNTPNYGVVTADFTHLVSLAFTPDGEFFTLGGTFDGNGYGTLSVNLVTRFGIPSFGIFGNFTYNPPAPPPPSPCSDCGPPPPCLDCGPPPLVPVPEPSTWAMMLLGFAGLGFATFRRSKARRLA